MAKIGFISPYKKGIKMAEDFAKEEGVDIICDVAIGNRALDIAEKMFTVDHVAAIIDRYPTSELLAKEYGDSIVEMGLSNYGIIKVVEKASKIDKRIAYITLYGKGNQGTDIALLKNIFHVTIDVFPIKANGDQADMADLLSREGYQVAFSAASCMAPHCQRVGIKFYLIDLDAEILRQSIRAAAAIAYIKQETEEIQSYIDNESHALLIMNADTNTVEVWNQALLGLVDHPFSLKKGMNLTEASDVAPFFRDLAANKRTLKIKNQVYYVATFLYQSNSSRLIAMKIVDLEGDIPVATGRSLNKKNASTFTAAYHFKDIIHKSRIMKTLTDRAKIFAESDSTILIQGESGTGKELMAQSIHNASARKSGPFVAVNCGALPESLIESELYGYDDGAFTGARKGGKVGLFELSQGGTLFLDEIGELPLSQQARLLRSLQEHQIVRVGGRHPIPIDNRIICATNRNLLDEVNQKNFRSDLYYRINVLSLRIPPLRERTDDIEGLVDAYTEAHAYRDGSRVHFSAALIAKMCTYSWPGNIRELYNFLERLTVTSVSNEIDPDYFMECFRELDPDAHLAAQSPAALPSVNDSRSSTLNDLNLQFIKKTYEECGYNMQATARTLGISRTTLWRKLKKTDAEVSS